MQLDLFGGAGVNVLDVEDKVERVLRDYPIARGYDNQLVLLTWLLEDGLAGAFVREMRQRNPALSLTTSDVVDALVSQAGRVTPVESITRVRRSIQSEGLYLPEQQHLLRRDRRRESFRQHLRKR